MAGTTGDVSRFVCWRKYTPPLHTQAAVVRQVSGDPWRGEGIGTRRSRSSGGGLTTSSRLGLWRKRFFRKRPARDERACARLIV